MIDDFTRGGLMGIDLITVPARVVVTLVEANLEHEPDVGASAPTKAA